MINQGLNTLLRSLPVKFPIISKAKIKIQLATNVPKLLSVVEMKENREGGLLNCAKTTATRFLLKIRYQILSLILLYFVSLLCCITPKFYKDFKQPDKRKSLFDIKLSISCLFLKINKMALERKITYFFKLIPHNVFNL